MRHRKYDAKGKCSQYDRAAAVTSIIMAQNAPGRRKLARLGGRTESGLWVEMPD